MWQLLGQYLLVVVVTAFKFVPGAVMTTGFGHNFIEKVLLTSIGGSLGVVVFTYTGDGIRAWIRSRLRRKPAKEAATRPEPSKLARGLWARFGLVGTALLTPPFFSPPIGTAIALAFGERPRRIILYNVLSMVLWAIIFAIVGAEVRSALGLDPPEIMPLPEGMQPQ